MDVESMQCRKDLFELEEDVLYFASCARYPLLKTTRDAATQEVLQFKC
jgi:hypothetical protein